MARFRWLVLVAAVLALAPVAQAAEPLRGQWHLDEPACGAGPCTNADSSGNGFTGTWVGAPSVVAGRWGNALHFPTKNDYVNAGSQPQLQPQSITVLAWVRSATVPGTVEAVLSNGAAGGCSHSSYAIYTGGSANTSGLRFYIWNGTAAPVSPAAGTAMWDGNWHFVAGTYDQTTVRLYIDGQEVGTGTPASGPIVYGLAANDNFTIGNYADPPECFEQTQFAGDVDEVRVYSRALTATEIGTLAAATGPNPPDLPPDGGGGNPPPVTPPPVTPPPGPMPTAGATVVAGPVVGTTFYSVPKASAAARTRPGDVTVAAPPSGLKPPRGYTNFRRLTADTILPVTSLLDTTKSTVNLTAAGNVTASDLFAAQFSKGAFKVTQGKGSPLTTLTMLGPENFASACRPGSIKKAARRPRRRLSGSGSGRFRTRGRNSTATVRGTQWSMEDTCSGTLTRVQEGTVLVRDLVKRKNVTLRAGQKYLARPKKKR